MMIICWEFWRCWWWGWKKKYRLRGVHYDDGNVGDDGNDEEESQTEGCVLLSKWDGAFHQSMFSSRSPNSRWCRWSSWWWWWLGWWWSWWWGSLIISQFRWLTCFLGAGWSGNLARIWGSGWDGIGYRGGRSCAKARRAFVEKFGLRRNLKVLTYIILSPHKD